MSGGYVRTVLLSATGVSNSIKIDFRRFHFGVGIIVFVSVGASLTYTVQVSGDNSNWTSHDTLSNQTVSANSNLAYPVSYIRLNATIVSGTVQMTIMQTGN